MGFGSGTPASNHCNRLSNYVGIGLGGRRWYRRWDGHIRHHPVIQPAPRLIHGVDRQSPLWPRFAKSPSLSVGMALPHSTTVNDIPDRSLRGHTIQMSVQGTTVMASNKPVTYDTEWCSVTHVPEDFDSQCL